MTKQKAILVTGVAGFIGFHLARLLLNKKHLVVGFDDLNDYYDVQLKKDRLSQLGIDQGKIEDLKVLGSPDNNFHFFKGGLEDVETWKFLADHFEIESIIHLAAQAGVRYSLQEPRKYVSSNVLGFLNVLEFCKETGLKKLIYASSSSVYGMDAEQPFSETERCDKPVSLYAATKRSNEMMAHAYHHLYKIESIGLRFFTVYGPWGRPDMAPMLFAKAAFENYPIKVFNHGEQSRDFTYVDDIVKGVYQVYLNQEQISDSSICNIGNGNPVALMDFISAIEDSTSKVLEKEFTQAQPGDVKVTFSNTEKLKSQFGYQPSVSLREGVNEFIGWYASYYHYERQIEI